MKFYKNLLVVGPILMIFCSACSTSPSGRKQLKFLPDQQMSQMGDQAFSQMRTKSPIMAKTSKEYKLSKCIVDELLVVMNQNPSDWQVELFKDDSPNAFAL